MYGNVKKLHAMEILFAMVGTAFADAKHAWGAWRRYSKTLSALSALTDAELTDIGLDRAGLREVAYKASYENRI